MNRPLLKPSFFVAATHALRRIAAGAAVFAAGLLTACGGGSGTLEAQLQPQAASPNVANVVSDTSSAGWVMEGDFATASGYLSKSAKVLRSSGSGAAKAEFALKIPQRGQYEVFVWWPQNLADAGTVDITVEHHEGRQTLAKDQRTGGGEWQSLGTYFFDSATAGAVVMRSQAGVRLYVDAVRLQRVEARAGISAMAFSADKLPVGLKDEPYLAQLGSRGGVPPYVYSVTSGELPPGLALDGVAGEISGRAAYAGEFSFTLQSRDAKGKSSLQSFTLYIGASAGSASDAPGMAPRPPGPARTKQSLAPTAAPELSGLLTIVSGMAEGEWRRVNLNNFSSVWTPADLRPMLDQSNPPPSAIIGAWSGFAWDANRAALLLYGGGHANYRGNDVYLWRASTQLWERASLPSAMAQSSLGHWNAIDGVDKAPASAHTYDNTIFLPILDRMLVFGGAADANGGHYLTQTAAGTTRSTGPYLFDPSRAHPDKVGGSTGSHVQRVAPYPDIVGGNMWSNRESWLNSSAASTPPVETLSNGCTGYAVENGRDVVYMRTESRLYRYEINALNNPAADVWKAAGRYYFGGSGDTSTCGYDFVRKIFLSTHSTQPFIFWNLANPGPANLDTLVTPTDPTGEFPTLLSSGNIRLRTCGLEFDPVRNDFKLWCGDGRVWTVTPPPVASATGWTIVKGSTPLGSVPSESLGTGILGKWKYVPNLDVFLGLADWVQGNIWIYKPRGWVNPASGTNLLPSVSIAAPLEGASSLVGANIAVSALAADGDGSVTKVEFFADGAKFGESLSAPYGTVWSGASVGAHSITAVATDNAGATKTSAPINITVNPIVLNAPPTVALVRPSAGLSVSLGVPITIEATASDSDGTVSRVEFFAGVSKIGESMASPYTMVWTSPPLGGSTITAVAFDNVGASSTSAPASVTVTAAPGSAGSVTLQRGVTPGSLVADTYLSGYHKTLNFGATTNLQDQFSTYPSLLRFAIFQSEGGPVPNGARITSAVLSVYKYTSYDMVYALHRVLQPWSESAATWNLRLSGTTWATAGANGVDTDIAAVPDATASTNFNPGWINFDVTSSVQQVSLQATPINHGWRLKGAGGNASGLKQMYSSEFNGTPTLRPKLVITYE